MALNRDLRINLKALKYNKSVNSDRKVVLLLGQNVPDNSFIKMQRLPFGSYKKEQQTVSHTPLHTHL